MLMVREWRHIKMAKRAGRGHDETGISGTAQGELAIPCRACPRLGVNLPTGWETADNRYVIISGRCFTLTGVVQMVIFSYLGGGR